MSETERWQWPIDSFQEWVESGHDMQPQLDLVKQIASSKYAAEFYPSTSISALIISNTESLEKNNPSICVTYLRDLIFEVSFSPNSFQTHNVVKYKCHRSQVFSLLESLFLRMKLVEN